MRTAAQQSLAMHRSTEFRCPESVSCFESGAWTNPAHLMARPAKPPVARASHVRRYADVGADLTIRLSTAARAIPIAASPAEEKDQCKAARTLSISRP